MRANTNTMSGDRAQLIVRLAQNSFILSLFYRFACWFYRTAKTSFIGSFFVTYDNNNTKCQSSFFLTLFRTVFGRFHCIRPIRFFCSKESDHSVVLNFMRSRARRLIRIPLGIYGVLLLTFSLVNLGILGITYIRLGFEGVEQTYLIITLAVFAMGMALCGTRRSLGYYLSTSRMGHFICFNIIGAEETSFAPEETVKGSILEAIIIGGLWGVLVLKVSLLYLVILPVALVVLYTILCIPEFGVILSIFLVPFAPTMALVGLVVFTAFCFLLKLLTGKRIIRMESIDWTVLLFMVLYIIGCFSSISVGLSFKPTLVFVCFMIGYFLVVNLIRNDHWFERAIGALVLSTFLEAAIGIYQNYFGEALTKWQDQSMFDDISGRVISTLDNPNMLAEYLIMCLPVIFACVWVKKGFSVKLSYFIPFVAAGTCLIFTWSRGAWLGFLISMVILLLMLTRKSLVAFLFGILAIPFAPLFLPQSIIHRFTSIGNMTDGSTSYRVFIWKGSFRLIKEHLFSGIGSGIDVFPLIYPKYSLAGIEAAPHSHMLYLQILVEMGLLGLLIFLSIYYLTMKMSISSVSNREMDGGKYISAGLFAGLTAALMQGFTDYIWYNYRMFLFFWLFLGLLVARNRISRNQTNDLLTI